MLVTLGDRAAADRLSEAALSAIPAAEVGDEPHAAIWLRRHIVRRLRTEAPASGPSTPASRRLLRETYRVSESVHAGLGALDTTQRAAIIAETIEGRGLGAVGSIVELDGVRLEQLLVRARREFISAATAVVDPRDDDHAMGPLEQRVRGSREGEPS